MNDAATNPAQAGSDSGQPSTDLNNLSDYDYAEPDEDQANDDQGEEGIDQNEPDEAAEDGQESEETREQEEGAEDEAEQASAPVEVNVPDDALVTLANGEKVPFGDLKKAPMFERDYRHKTQELGNKTRDLEAKSNRVLGTMEALIDFMADRLPPEPTPDLALTNPSAYVAQKAQHEVALAELQKVVQLGTNARAVQTELTAEQYQAALEDANTKLVERLPDIANPEKRATFNKVTWETAQHFGFSPEELNATTDYRLLWMGHYAAMGLKAEQAGKKAAQKIQAAPAATPMKRAQAKGNPQFLRSKEAMRRLEKSGSIKDALLVDFD